MARGRAANEALRRAMNKARLREEDVAQALGVDPKTVERWIGGRMPQPRNRWGLVELLKADEFDLWPESDEGKPGISPEIVAIYPHRAAVPRETWRDLFAEATKDIGILVYSGLFVAEDVELIRLIGGKARNGVAVRIILGDPESPHVAQRGLEEGIADAMAAKIRNAIVLFQSLHGLPGVEIRLHPTVLYNSIYWADGEMLVNQHIYGLAAAHAPVTHLNRRNDQSDVFETFISSFERVWSGARPL